MDESQFSQLRVSDSSDRRCDRLSELVDSLIFVILSLLPIKDVVRTTLLSKRWKDLWTTIPYLNFLNTDSYFIRKALAQWKGAKILKFKLTFHHDLPPYFDLLLHFAIEKQVEELSIDLGYLRGFLPGLDSEYFVPQRLFSCSSIFKLSLFSCKLKIEQNVQWNQLKSLTIECVSSLSKVEMNQVISGSPLLEELNLYFWHISENLNIRSGSLKMLKIRWDVQILRVSETLVISDVFKIWAPNLLTLEISAFVNGTCLLDVPSLTTAILNFQHFKEEINFEEFKMFNEVFRSIRHVEKVTLSDWCIKFLMCMKKKDMVVPFSNANYLKFYSAKASKMLDVLEMFPKLMAIIIVDCNQRYEDGSLALGEEIHVAMVDACQSLASKADFPIVSLLHLKTLEITWPISDPSIIAVAEFLLENAHVLEKMVLRLRMGEANPETFILAEEKVMSMPRSSPTAQLIIIKD